MADPFGDNVEFSQIPSSQDLLFHHAAKDSLDPDSGYADDSDPATPIFVVSPPDSSEQPSQDHFETPPEEAQPASSSEDVCADRTLDLAADAKLGFSETEVAQKPAADSGGRGEEVMVEVPESSPKKMKKDTKSVEVNNLVVSGVAKNDLGSNDCSTQLLSSGSVGKALVSDTEDCTQLLDCRDCGGKGLMEELGMVKKAAESIDCNEAEVDVLDSIDRTEVVGLDSGDNDVQVLEDEGTGKNGLALDTNDEGLVLGSGIANDGAQKGEDDNGSNVMDWLEFVSNKIPKAELDPKYENLSILEIAKLRGVTFPRPSWWDDERKFP